MGPINNEILINVTPPETRVALVENGVLQELQIERTTRRGIVGNIYKGVVCRVLPGMQAAFVDIGLERTAFLHQSDLSIRDVAKICDGNIGTLLREGQEIIVQVAKEPLGLKGARLTTELSVPSRYQVYLPYSCVVGVSQRIENDAERTRLRMLMDSFQQECRCGGYIARTAAEAVDQFALRADMMFLQRLWMSIEERIPSIEPRSLVYADLPLYVRALRDLCRTNVEKIRVDAFEAYERIVKFAEDFMPEAKSLIDHYKGERPLFDIYGVEEEVQRALDRRVELKSGGHIVFDQTEAMTTIDVNTGSFVGSRNLEETVFKTNLEAAQVIARQLRLRNLGGIIIIDFIDMEDPEHRRQVLTALEKYLERDYAKTSISDVSPLGLVQMTRKRTRESLEHILCETCPACGGRGMVKTSETVCLEIYREVMREVRQYNVQELMILAANPVVDMLLDEQAACVSELEALLHVRIRFRAEAEYTQEQFDIVLL